jgi:hypothetical protein
MYFHAPLSKQQWHHHHHHYHYHHTVFHLLINIPQCPHTVPYHHHGYSHSRLSSLSSSSLSSTTILAPLLFFSFLIHIKGKVNNRLLWRWWQQQTVRSVEEDGLLACCCARWGGQKCKETTVNVAWEDVRMVHNVKRKIEDNVWGFTKVKTGFRKKRMVQNVRQEDKGE